MRTMSVEHLVHPTPTPAHGASVLVPGNVFPVSLLIRRRERLAYKAMWQGRSRESGHVRHHWPCPTLKSPLVQQNPLSLCAVC